jgi:hypothetical protein
MVFEGFHNDIPIPILNFIHRYTPNARWRGLRKTKADVDQILGSALRDRNAKLTGGKEDELEGKRDLLTLLCWFLFLRVEHNLELIQLCLPVKARLSGDKSRTLTDEEIVEQV